MHDRNNAFTVSEEPASRVSRLHVVLATNNAHAPFAAVAARSAADSNPQALDVTFLCLDIGDEQKRSLVRAVGPNASAETVDVSLDFAKGLSSRRWHPLVYAKLAIPDLFPSRERTLYLDNDTITVGPIHDLASIDFGRHVIAGIADAGNVCNGLHWSHRTEFGLAPDDPYINGGVVLLNNAAWRRDGIASQLLAWMQTNSTRLLANEQDGINAFLRGRIYELPLSYNIQSQLEGISFWHTLAGKQFHAAMQSPRILHCTARNKPWDSHGYCFGAQHFAAVARRVEEDTAYRYSCLRPAARFRRWVSRQNEQVRRDLILSRRRIGQLLRTMGLRP